MLTNIDYQYLTWQFKLKTRDDKKAVDELEDMLNGIDTEYISWQLDEFNAYI